MAGHAGFNGRDIGESGCFNRGMTIPAIDADAGDVVFVAERHRLLLCNIYIGNVSQPVGIEQNREADADKNQREQNADSSK